MLNVKCGVINDTGDTKITRRVLSSWPAGRQTDWNDEYVRTAIPLGGSGNLSKYILLRLLPPTFRFGGQVLVPAPNDDFVHIKDPGSLRCTQHKQVRDDILITSSLLLSMHFRTSQRLIAHIDCDCFFASCEILRDPSIRDKCVCVGGDIVLTSNYQARKYGVKLGTPSWEVEKMVPRGSLVMLPPDLALYGDISDRINDYLTQWSNRVDVFGIDESWIDVTGIPECLGLSYDQFILKIQQDILRTIGVSASIGLSNTKLRAKMLGEVHKPLGIAVGVRSEDFFHHTGDLYFGKIPFIGRRLQERIQYHVSGRNVRGFMDIGFWKLKELIGTSATDVWLELMGVNAYKHRGPDRTEKSISATRSFNHAKTSDKRFLWEHLLMNFERGYSRLLDKNLETNHVYISFRDKEKRWFGYEKKLGRHTSCKETLISEMKKLFDATHNPNITYRSTGVTFAHLEIATPKQYMLAEYSQIAQLENNHSLQKAINLLNKKYGRMTVTRAGSGSVDPRYMNTHQKKNLKKTDIQKIKGMRDMRII